MNELDIFDLYNNSNSKHIESFSNSIDSTVTYSNDYDKVECDLEWLELMEETIRYIDNILRNPNRFIVNEEDIVKIELAKRVTVESIKHLSRNTNLIQDIDPKTGDVKPSKILNINKEESFNTYENRFIYSLIQNMITYINYKKKNMVLNSSLKSNKKLEYFGNAKVGGKKINISLNLESKLDQKDSHNDKEGNDLLGRIDKLELQIKDLTRSEVYQNIHKLHISLVTSPIKKTNVILKNVNFQYAVNLWNYMQNNMEDGTKRDKKSEKLLDDFQLKKYIDESFLLNYLVVESLSKENLDSEEKKEISEKIVNNMIQKVIEFNSNITEKDLKDLVGQKFAVIKYKYKANENEIEKIFKDSINNYMKNIEKIKL